MAVDHLGSFHRNLENKTQMEAPRERAWTWTRFSANLVMSLASLGSCNADLFLCLRPQAELQPARFTG